MPGAMNLTIWDVEHGACATLLHASEGAYGRLAMIDVGDSVDWRPSSYIRNTLGRATLDYLMITNADQDHLSDLEGLHRAGIVVNNLLVNKSPSVDVLRRLKVEGSNGQPLTADIERYLAMRQTYTEAPAVGFDQLMGGIKRTSYHAVYPVCEKTNDLSLAVFIEYRGFKILFPGDLERPGWLQLLMNPAFCQELSEVTVLVASHHGRENGYCAEIFDYCRPKAVVMSDKGIEHDTQRMVPTYRARVQAHHPEGVRVKREGAGLLAPAVDRRVLTTRSDGHIRFVVNDNEFYVFTEYQP